MPEIAECYTIAEKIPEIGKIEDIDISNNFFKYINKNKSIDLNLKDAVLKKPFAYGKSIWFPVIYNKEKYFLISQLGMTGSWFLNQAHGRTEKNNHLTIKGKKQTLIYSDPRMFGKMNLIKDTKENIIKKMKWGLDPLESNIDDLYNNVYKKWAKSNKSIKVLLLEQNLIFGIGNYLASEILFYAKIDPRTLANKLTKADILKILKNTKVVVEKALKAEGNSFAGGYIHPDGQMGTFLEQIKVYGKEGEKCPKCSSKIKKIDLMGRSTFLCENCQKRR